MAIYSLISDSCDPWPNRTLESTVLLSKWRRRRSGWEKYNYHFVNSDMLFKVWHSYFSMRHRRKRCRESHALLCFVQENFPSILMSYMRMRCRHCLFFSLSKRQRLSVDEKSVQLSQQWRTDSLMWVSVFFLSLGRQATRTGRNTSGRWQWKKKSAIGMFVCDRGCVRWKYWEKEKQERYALIGH